MTIAQETDAELEKFIDRQIDESQWDVYDRQNNIAGFSNDETAALMSKSAAFAAKRARERAIGEYHAKIMNWLTGRGLGRIATDLNSHLLKSL